MTQRTHSQRAIGVIRSLGLGSFEGQPPELSSDPAARPAPASLSAARSPASRCHRLVEQRLVVAFHRSASSDQRSRPVPARSGRDGRRSFLALRPGRATVVSGSPSGASADTSTCRSCTAWRQNELVPVCADSSRHTRCQSEDRDLIRWLCAGSRRARARCSRPTRCACGGGGIRTHGSLATSAVFKTAAFDRSATPPE